MKCASVGLLITLHLLLLWFTPTHAQPNELTTADSSDIEFNTFSFAQHSLHYAYSGDVSKPGILFIHGTPGSWHAFQRYLKHVELQNDYFLVSIDRPGWGESKTSLTPSKSSSPGKSKPTTSSNSFAFQAEFILAVMQHYPDKRWILVGHSLGASIAPKVALLDSENINGLLLLSGSLAPSLGKPRWFNRVANTLLLRWVLPSQWRYSNQEIMALEDELKTMEGDLQTKVLDIPVVLIQGMRDKLVSPKNAAYVRNKWPQSFANLDVVEIPKGGHFTPWKQTPLVLEKLRGFPYK